MTVISTEEAQYFILVLILTVSGFSILTRDILTCVQEEPGVEPPVLEFVDDYPTKWNTVSPMMCSCFLVFNRWIFHSELHFSLTAGSQKKMNMSTQHMGNSTQLLCQMQTRNGRLTSQTIGPWLMFLFLLFFFFLPSISFPLTACVKYSDSNHVLLCYLLNEAVWTEIWGQSVALRQSRWTMSVEKKAQVVSPRRR